MTLSKYSFIRTELRVLQSTCDNETFLNAVADMIGKREEKIEELAAKIHYNSWEKIPTVQADSLQLKKLITYTVGPTAPNLY